eukprot:m.355289 g.355289  ORF g.355289 m.355289 type:complete len:643 (+) comp17213_c0_seq1:258-2186(+)
MSGIDIRDHPQNTKVSTTYVSCLSGAAMLAATATDSLNTFHSEGPLSLQNGGISPNTATTERGQIVAQAAMYTMTCSSPSSSKPDNVALHPFDDPEVDSFPDLTNWLKVPAPATDMEDDDEEEGHGHGHEESAFTAGKGVKAGTLVPSISVNGTHDCSDSQHSASKGAGRQGSPSHSYCPIAHEEQAHLSFLSVDDEVSPFEWSIEDKAEMFPVQIDVKDHTKTDPSAVYSLLTPRHKTRVQQREALLQEELQDYFHPQNLIVPSPSPRVGRSRALRQQQQKQQQQQQHTYLSPFSPVKQHVAHHDHLQVQSANHQQGQEQLAPRQPIVQLRERVASLQQVEQEHQEHLEHPEPQAQQQQFMPLKDQSVGKSVSVSSQFETDSSTRTPDTSVVLSLPSPSYAEAKRKSLTAGTALSPRSPCLSPISSIASHDDSDREDLDLGHEGSYNRSRALFQPSPPPLHFSPPQRSLQQSHSVDRTSSSSQHLIRSASSCDPSDMESNCYWDVKSVPELLAKLSLQSYCQCFADEEIDMHVLLTLSEDDLKSIGVSTLGARRKLLLAIADLVVLRGVAGVGFLKSVYNTKVRSREPSMSAGLSGISGISSASRSGPASIQSSPLSSAQQVLFSASSSSSHRRSTSPRFV